MEGLILSHLLFFPGIKSSSAKGSSAPYNALHRDLQTEILYQNTYCCRRVSAQTSVHISVIKTEARSVGTMPGYKKAFKPPSQSFLCMWSFQPGCEFVPNEVICHPTSCPQHCSKPTYFVQMSEQAVVGSLASVEMGEPLPINFP